MRVIVAVAFCVTACATTMKHQASFPVEYAVEDRPYEEKIYVTYSNRTKKKICISSDEWPNKRGHIDYANRRIFIIVDNIKYFINEMDGGYCIGGCNLSVIPGNDLVGVFNYSDFKLPFEKFNKEKNLKFSPMATYCKGLT